MATITVREVLTLPVLRGSFVVAGENGLDRAVTGVNVMEVPDIESFVKEGELLLTLSLPSSRSAGQGARSSPSLSAAAA